jgi:hypothetical protein
MQKPPGFYTLIPRRKLRAQGIYALGVVMSKRTEREDGCRWQGWLCASSPCARAARHNMGIL